MSREITENTNKSSSDNAGENSARRLFEAACQEPLNSSCLANERMSQQSNLDDKLPQLLIDDSAKTKAGTKPADWCGTPYSRPGEARPWPARAGEAGQEKQPGLPKEAGKPGEAGQEKQPGLPKEAGKPGEAGQEKQPGLPKEAGKPGEAGKPSQEKESGEKSHPQDGRKPAGEKESGEKSHLPDSRKPAGERDGIKHHDPRQDWVDAEWEMNHPELSNTKPGSSDEVSRNRSETTDLSELEQQANYVSDLINANGARGFGDSDCRAELKNIFADALKNGCLNELLNEVKIGNQLDTKNPRYQTEINLQYSAESNEVKMMMSFWPVKMGPKEVDCIKL